MEKFRPVCGPSLVAPSSSSYQWVTPVTVAIAPPLGPNLAEGGRVGFSASYVTKATTTVSPLAS